MKSTVLYDMKYVCNIDESKNFMRIFMINFYFFNLLKIFRHRFGKKSILFKTCKKLALLIKFEFFQYSDLFKLNQKCKEYCKTELTEVQIELISRDNLRIRPLE